MLSLSDMKEGMRLSLNARKKTGICVVKLGKSGGDLMGKEFAMRRIHLPNENESNIQKQSVQIIIDNIQQFCRLRHEHLIPYVACLHDLNLNCICIVTELCPDGSLYKHVTNQEPGPLPESRVLDWFSQIVSGLSYLHSRDIIHGDVRAKNIMYWATKNICKLSDYRVMCQVAELPNINHISIDAAQHLAPEFWIAGSQRQMSSYFNKTTDMFSLGCLLHFLCCRADVFDGDDFEKISKRVWSHNYSHIPSLYRADIQQLLNKLLHVDSRNRPTVADVSQILKARGGECKNVTDSKLKSMKDSVQRSSHKKQCTTPSRVFRLKRVSGHMQVQHGYRIIECDPQDGGFHVDWATLRNPEISPDTHKFNWIMMAEAGQCTDVFLPWTAVSRVYALFAPPMLLPEEIADSPPVVMHAQLSRNNDDLDLSICLHEDTPDALCLLGPVKVQLHLTARVNGTKWQFQGHEISLLRRSKAKIFTAVVCKHFPWMSVDRMFLPKAIITISRASEDFTFWYEGLSPIKLQSGSDRFPTIDWATLKGSRNWDSMWLDVIKECDGILYLPPLCIPLSAVSGYEGNTDNTEICLVSYLNRIGNSLHYQAVLHPNTPESLDERNCTVTIQFSLEVVNKTKQTQETISSGPITVRLRRLEPRDSRMYPNHWSLILTRHQWNSFDKMRPPRMSVELRRNERN